jgi:membrane associated rhomboid family serine protease
MKDFLIGALIIGLFCLPFILTVVLIIMVRRRRKRERLGISPKIDSAYENLIDPFSLRTNWLTCIILTLLSVIYVCELAFAVDYSNGAFSASITTLMALGGASHDLIIKGDEWRRIFTAPFLHGGFMHLLMNAIALFYAGRILEKQIGAAWLLAVYFTGGVAGSLFSIYLNSPNTLTVGASGAVMGLFAALMVASFHADNKTKRHGLQMLSLRVLIPSMLPQGGTHIDYAAHFGGAVGGGLCALIMLINWQPASLPGLRRFAMVTAIIGIAATCFSFYRTAVYYHEYKALGICLNLLNDEAKKQGTSMRQYINTNEAWIENCVIHQLQNTP